MGSDIFVKIEWKIFFTQKCIKSYRSQGETIEKSKEIVLLICKNELYKRRYLSTSGN